MTKEIRANVAIIGAGPVGLAAARALRKEGVDNITVVDSSPVGTRFAGIAAPGNIAPDFDDLRGRLSGYPGYINLYRRSRELYEELQEQVKERIDFAPTRILQVSQEGKELSAIADHYAKSGFNFEMLTPEQVTKLEPAISANCCVGALLLGKEISGHVDPVKLVSWLADDCRSQNVNVVEGVKIEKISETKEGFRLESVGLTIDTEYVVNAAGASVAKICGLLDPKYANMAIWPVKGHFVTFAPVQNLRLGIDILNDIGSIVQYSSGEIKIGGGSDENTYEVEQWSIDRLLRSARETIPALESAPVVNTGFGFRALVRNHEPIVERIKNKSNFIIAGGLHRTGITNCLGVGEIVAKIVTDTGERKFGIDERNIPNLGMSTFG